MKLAIAGSGKIVCEAIGVLREIPEIQVKALWVRDHSLQKGRALADQYGEAGTKALPADQYGEVGTKALPADQHGEAGTKALPADQHGEAGTKALPADQYGEMGTRKVPEVYTDFRDLLRRRDIDAVYIGLVNTAHLPYAKEALLAGKHVIVEKPLTVSLAGAQELAALAEEKHLYVLEGMTLLYGNMLPAMKGMMKSIGRTRLVTGNYSQYSSRYDDYRRGIVKPAFDPALCGGALMDINIYNIALAEALFGMPQQAHYYANRGFNGVDTSGTAILTYPDFQVSLSGAKDCDGESGMTIQGEEGMVKLCGKPNMPDRLCLVMRTKSQTGSGTEGKIFGEGTGKAEGSSGEGIDGEIEDLNTGEHRMRPEFLRFARIIDEHDDAAAREALDHSLAVMRIMDLLK